MKISSNPNSKNDKLFQKNFENNSKKLFERKKPLANRVLKSTFFVVCKRSKINLIKSIDQIREKNRILFIERK